MAKNKENLEVQDSTKELLGSLLNEHKDQHYNFVQHDQIKISTGSLLLDQQMTVKTGSVLRFAGPNSSGKTSQALLIAQNFMAAVKGAKTIYVKAEGRLGEEIRERADLKFVFTAEEWNAGTVFVLETNVFETMAKIVETLLKECHAKGILLCVIIDSMDGLILQKDLEDKGYGDNQKVAGVPLITKIMFKRLALPIGKFGCLYIITSQVSANIKLDPYSKEAPRAVAGAGGNSLNHQADYMLEYEPRFGSHFICENPDEKPSPKNKVIGHLVKIRIAKSAKETDGNIVEIPIKRGRKGNAVWVEKEVVDCLLGNGLIIKKGAWFKVDESIRKGIQEKTGVIVDEQIQGLNNVYEFFEANKNVVDYLVGMFKP